MKLKCGGAGSGSEWASTVPAPVTTGTCYVSGGAGGTTVGIQDGTPGAPEGLLAVFGKEFIVLISYMLCGFSSDV